MGQRQNTQNTADRAQKEKQGEESNALLFNFGSSEKRLVFSFGSDATAFDFQVDMSTRSKSLGENFIEPKSTEVAYKEAGSSMSTRNTTESSSSKGRYYKFDSSRAVDEASKFAATTPVHPHSSLTARRILEHLDRSVPSPKEKLQEIKLARMRVPPKSDALIVDDKSEKLDVITTDTQKNS